jgi:hypothetical protein
MAKSTIDRPTHPKRPRKEAPGKPPTWWGGGNWIRIKKYGGGTKHKSGRRKGEMIRD